MTEVNYSMKKRTEKERMLDEDVLATVVNEPGLSWKEIRQRIGYNFKTQRGKKIFDGAQYRLRKSGAVTTRRIS